MNRYEHLLRSMEPSLDRAILRVLTGYVGKANAIGRDALTLRVGQLGFKSHERQVRETIKNLRREGFLICSTPGENGGYYLAADRIEFEEFIAAEYRAKITDMSVTLAAMTRAADQQFGSVIQGRLL